MLQVIYLPARPTENFKSFFTPVLNFFDTRVFSSWIGPWSWGGLVKPVSGGGIPAHIPRIEAKFIFKDGGHIDFQTKFERLKERLHHARELGLLPSQNLEPPPPYDASAPGGSSSNVPLNTQAQQHPPPPAPDEPPPDYAEAQAQAVSMRLEERMREEAERR